MIQFYKANICILIVIYEPIHKIIKKYIFYWNINIIFLALVSSFHLCSLQNLTDANEEYQKQIEDMKAQIEEAAGQVERYTDDYVKLKVRT